MAELTFEYMRELENSLTSEQKQRAFDLAKQNGWQTFDSPPIWVWHQLFIQAKGEVPAVSGQSTQTEMDK